MYCKELKFKWFVHGYTNKIGQDDPECQRVKIKETPSKFDKII